MVSVDAVHWDQRQTGHPSYIFSADVVEALAKRQLSC